MIAQWISNQLACGGRQSRIGRSFRRLLFVLRRLRLAASDPSVTIQIAGERLRAPLSHALPLYVRDLPYYNTNLGRLARAVYADYPDSVMVDVGANIGDSVAFVRSETSMPVLCVEGAPHFFQLLQENLSSFPNAQAIEAFVGEENGAVAGSLVSEAGTGSIRHGGGTVAKIAVRSIGEIVSEHPQFAHCKLLKIDTDGFDTKILRGARDFLSRCTPVIFFEYDPHLLDLQGERGLDVFPYLQSLGYEFAMVYENTGQYLLTAPLSDQPLLEDLDRFYRGFKAQRYCDLAVFHGEDAPLMRAFRASEAAFFDRERRTGVNGAS